MFRHGRDNHCQGPADFRLGSIDARDQAQGGDIEFGLKVSDQNVLHGTRVRRLQNDVSTTWASCDVDCDVTARS